MNTAAKLLTHARALLLDFDGPICSVFAGIPAPIVADQLRAILTDGGHTDLPEVIVTSEDPFDVFRYAATVGPDEARYVEAAFTANEVEAIPTATPTEGAHHLIHTWHQSGRPLAIVSNNSTTAISAYLDLYNLRPLVNFVSARTSPDAALFKPNPHLLHLAITALAVPPVECAFIGDSLTDVAAARAAGVRCIGYANKPGKHDRMREQRADAVTNFLAELAPEMNI